MGTPEPPFTARQAHGSVHQQPSLHEHSLSERTGPCSGCGTDNIQKGLTAWDYCTIPLGTPAAEIHIFPPQDRCSLQVILRLPESIPSRSGFGMRKKNHGTRRRTVTYAVLCCTQKRVYRMQTEKARIDMVMPDRMRHHDFPMLDHLSNCN